MKRLAKNVLIRISSNVRFQRLLERNVALSQYLMGIGSGGSIESSGERVLVDKLRLYAKTNESLCVFDVGANKGEFLNLIRGGLRGVSFHVHAFEPSRFTYSLLQENAGAYSDVTLNNLGLGKQIGERELFFDKAGSALASLSKRRLGHFGVDFKYSETVRIDTLDSYCLRHEVKRIDLLKLDVEGHEIGVLESGARMFASRQVKMVSFEFGGCNIDSRTYFQDFYYFFRENAMSRIFRIAPSGYLVPILEYKEVYEQFHTTNFLVLQD